MSDIEKLKKSSFDPHLNTKFEVNTEIEGMVEVELVDVADKTGKTWRVFHCYSRDLRTSFSIKGFTR